MTLLHTAEKRTWVVTCWLNNCTPLCSGSSTKPCEAFIISFRPFCRLVQTSLRPRQVHVVTSTLHFLSNVFVFVFSPSLFSEQLLNWLAFIKEKFKSDAHMCNTLKLAGIQGRLHARTVTFLQFHFLITLVREPLIVTKQATKDFRLYFDKLFSKPKSKPRTKWSPRFQGTKMHL